PPPRSPTRPMRWPTFRTTRPCRLLATRATAPPHARCSPRRRRCSSATGLPTTRAWWPRRSPGSNTTKSIPRTRKPNHDDAGAVPAGDHRGRHGRRRARRPEAGRRRSRQPARGDDGCVLRNAGIRSGRDPRDRDPPLPAAGLSAMIEMFLNSVRLFLRGKLFKDFHLVLLRLAIGVAIATTLVVLLAW